jgi:hypothetical protein
MHFTISPYDPKVAFASGRCLPIALAADSANRCAGSFFFTKLKNLFSGEWSFSK